MTGYDAAYWERFALQRRAYYVVREALRKGHLERGSCEVGGGCSGRVEGHHEDYSHPLDVTWLCRSHHLDRHAELKAAA